MNELTVLQPCSQRRVKKAALRWGALQTVNGRSKKQENRGKQAFRN
jgi:hypothetical protein